MLSPERFGEALAGVLAEAKSLGGSISMERVRQIADLPGLTPDQWELAIAPTTSRRHTVL